jgi:hypothetical protein
MTLVGGYALLIYGFHQVFHGEPYIGWFLAIAATCLNYINVNWAATSLWGEKRDRSDIGKMGNIHLTSLFHAESTEK